MAEQTPVSLAELEQLPILNIDSLARPIARLTIFGSEHVLWPIDGRGFDLYTQLTERAQLNNGEGAIEGMQLLRTIVKNAVPTLPNDQVERLTPDQLMTIAQRGIERVDAATAAIASAEKNGGALPAGQSTATAAAPTTSDTSPRRSTTRSPRR